MPRYIGVDLHTTCFTVCVLTDKGESSFQEYKLTELTCFEKTLRRSDQLAVEATGNARFFSEQVRAKVRRVVIVNPRQFEVIKQSRSKTERAGLLQPGAVPLKGTAAGGTDEIGRAEPTLELGADP